MRLLVTGGLGVNGAWLVRELVRRGQTVSVFDNRGGASLLAEIADSVDILTGDIRVADEVAGAVERCRPHCIVHLAALVDCDTDPSAAIAVNVGGTANVCAAAVAAGVPRVVYTSSKAVYAPGTGRHGYPAYEPVTEDHDRRPSSLYGITKLAAEHVLEWYVRRFDLDGTSLRFATVFGPGRLQRHEAISAYSAMVELPSLGEPFELDRGADERDQLIYVLDVADATACVALAPDPFEHSAYNVAAGPPLTIGEFAEVIRGVVPGARLAVGPGLDPLGYGANAPYYLDIDSARLEREFGWRPQFGSERAVRHFHALLRSRAQGSSLPELNR